MRSEPEAVEYEKPMKRSGKSDEDPGTNILYVTSKELQEKLFCGHLFVFKGI